MQEKWHFITPGYGGWGHKVGPLSPSESPLKASRITSVIFFAAGNPTLQHSTHAYLFMFVFVVPKIWRNVPALGRTPGLNSGSFTVCFTGKCCFAESTQICKANLPGTDSGRTFLGGFSPGREFMARSRGSPHRGVLYGSHVTVRG